MARFDFDELFDEDYLDFYVPFIDDEASEQEAELISMLSQLEEGQRVLDVACGHGRIANRLAAEGAVVTGIDRCELFLERARADAAAKGLDARYEQGDMRELEYDQEFDIVISWFTAFGYYDDDTCRDILQRMHDALEPGGRLILETINRDLGKLTMEDRPSVKEVNGEFMIDLGRYDPIDGRLYVRRFVTRNEKPIREMEYFIRLFTFTEIRDWMKSVGFELVHAFGGEGESYRLDSSRLVVLAERG